ncbi:MAG TPA: hypothetical protein VI032_16995 [Burkholderiaceae bacterium]
MTLAVRAFVVAAACAALLACGGGSGPPPADQPHLFPTVVSDTVPPGRTVDLTTANYFPFAVGDTWTYDVFDPQIREFTGELSTRVVSGPDPQGVYVTETSDSSSGSTTRTRYKRTAQGLVNLEPLSGLLSARAASIVGPLLVTPTPMTPIGLERTSLRSGSWGVDEDGDGVFDGFELIYRQSFRGFLNLNAQSQTASVRSVFNLKLLPTRAGYEGRPLTLIQTETMAPGLGPISLGLTVLQGGSEQHQTLTLNSATIAGQRMPRDPAPLFATSAHADQAYDALRGRYLLALPTGQTHGPLILAVDTATRMTSVIKNLDAEPFAMAVSSDGTSLFVSTLNREVIRFRLSDMQEIDRLTVANSLCAVRLIASPTESNVLLAYVGFCGPSSAREVILIRDMIAVGTPYSVSDFLQTFSSDGTMVYSREPTRSSEPGFVRFDVTVGGLTYKDSVVARPSITGFPIVDLEARGGRVRLADAVLDEASFAQVGSLSNMLGPCAATADASRWICRPLNEPDPMLHSLSVFNTATRNREGRVDYEFSFAATFITGFDDVKLTKGGPGELLMSRGGIQFDPSRGQTMKSEFYLVRSTSMP